jgi:hypothetical protein
LLFSQAELTAGTIAACGTGVSPTTKTVNVTVNGVGMTDFANISLGGGFGFATGFGTNPVAISGVNTGTFDLVAYRTGLAGASATDKAQFIRDLNVPDGGSAGTVDFNGSSAFTVASATITLAGASGGETILQSMQYLTGASCTFGILNTTQNATAPTLTAYGIPAAQQRASDYHVISVSAATGSTATRTILTSFHTLANKTVTLGAALPTPTITVLTAAYKRLQAALTLPAEYTSGATLTYSQQGVSRTASVTASAAYLGSQNVTLAFPDFAGVAGWTDSWAPASGATANWTLIASATNITQAGLCVEGALLKNATISGSN